MTEEELLTATGIDNDTLATARGLASNEGITLAAWLTKAIETIVSGEVTVTQEEDETTYQAQRIAVKYGISYDEWVAKSIEEAVYLELGSELEASDTCEEPLFPVFLTKGIHSWLSSYADANDSDIESSVYQAIGLLRKQSLFKCVG